MIDPKNSDLGRKVIYRPPATDVANPRVEEGVLTSFTAKYVFVRYGSE